MQSSSENFILVLTVSMLSVNYRLYRDNYCQIFCGVRVWTVITSYNITYVYRNITFEVDVAQRHWCQEHWQSVTEERYPTPLVSETLAFGH